MGIGRADEIAEQHAGQLQIVDIVALALGEADILDALALAAHALEGGGAFGCRGVMSFILQPPWRCRSVRPRHTEIALTMFW
jgi:hypothetical protein